jgi:hypothetical protein
MDISTMQKNIIQLICPLALVLCTFSSVAGDFYKWEDENGVTHYTSTPPKDAENTKVRTYNTKGSPVSATTAKTEDKTKTTSIPTAVSEAPKKDPERCKLARKNLETLKQHARVRIEENGKLRYLSEKEHAQKMDDAQKTIKDNC